MRRESFTFCCPMNSASRCGRSDSSTTDSSASTSGVVISVRVIVAYRVGRREAEGKAHAARDRAPRSLVFPRPLPLHSRGTHGVVRILRLEDLHWREEGGRAALLLRILRPA